MQAMLTGVRLADGRCLACEAIMANFGWRLNDDYLQDLVLDRDGEGFKILASTGAIDINRPCRPAAVKLKKARLEIQTAPFS